MGAHILRRRGHSGRRMIAGLLAALAWSWPAAAGDAAAVAGTYCLQGVHEVGSCLRLAADGKYEYFLSYGAYDELSEGTWRRDGADIVLDSPAYDRRPGFTLKEVRKSASGGYDMVVESNAGHGIAGVDVSVTCDGKASAPEVTQQNGLTVICAERPTAVALGLGMFGVAPQSVDVSTYAGPEKGYVFVFEPGDLGKKRFAGVRLKIGPDALDMTYDDTPVGELKGRPFHYVREAR